MRAAAEEFLELFHAENPEAGPAGPRIAAVRREIEETGTYWHTSEELAFGARVAWRNNARCIGRLYWRSLQVRDLRTVSDAAGVAEQCFEHLRAAGNGGRIRPLISVFAPETPARRAPRIWNEQLIRYAGYDQPGGRVLGDPRYCGFTDDLVQRGWRPPEPRGAFDVLPLVVETVEEGPRMFPVPGEAVLEVPFEHPELDWFSDLGLRWHAVPVISNNRLVIGGVTYPAAPFNGWYMGTEIGARNLADHDRYDLIPTVAHRMGLDTTDEASLWRDQALVEINRAVLHSFRRQRRDHHRPPHRVPPVPHPPGAGGAGGPQLPRGLELDRAADVGLADPGLPPVLRLRGPVAELLPRRRDRPPGPPGRLTARRTPSRRRLAPRVGAG